MSWKNGETDNRLIFHVLECLYFELCSFSVPPSSSSHRITVFLLRNSIRRLGHREKFTLFRHPRSHIWLDTYTYYLSHTDTRTCLSKAREHFTATPFQIIKLVTGNVSRDNNRKKLTSPLLTPNQVEQTIATNLASVPHKHIPTYLIPIPRYLTARIRGIKLKHKFSTFTRIQSSTIL